MLSCNNIGIILLKTVFVKLWAITLDDNGCKSKNVNLQFSGPAEQPLIFFHRQESRQQGSEQARSHQEKQPAVITAG